MLIYADTASLAEIEALDEHPWVSGFTTNPTLFKAAGVRDPERHAKEIVSLTDKPVSIDGPPEKVWGLGSNAIPKFVDGIVPDRNGRIGFALNFTAVISDRRANVCRHLAREDDIISVFAGRIADTGRDPAQIINAAQKRDVKVLWASTRQVSDYLRAERAGCDIITMTPPLIAKLAMLNMPLEVLERDTIAQFDADRIEW